LGVAEDTEAKGGWRGFGGTALTIAATALISVVITYTATKGMDWYFADEKALQITTPASQNLVAVPNALSGRLEVSYVNGPNDKQPVQSLFGYRITVLNKSQKQTAENISLYVFPPDNVTLVSTPQVSTNPEALAKIIEKEREPVKNGFHITLAYLQPGQSVTYSYTGLSGQKIEGSSSPSVEVNAKDWKPIYQKSDDYINDASVRKAQEDLFRQFEILTVAMTILFVISFLMFGWTRRGRY
jgi:hypothetical protein